jgi:hyperosmotically inducible periplasmic protein
MKHLRLLTLLVCLVVPLACTNGNPSTQAAKEPGRRTTDSDLKSKIESGIKSDPQLQAADVSVSADADKNRATISGTVESEAMRSKAIEIARAAQPGLTIEDKIDVKPREVSKSEYTPELARAEVERARTHKETVGSSIDDAWIHSKIVAKLLGDKDTPERKINVDVNKNVVTLRGTVDTAEQKAEAERVARETDGVKRVINQLRVAKG